MNLGKAKATNFQSFPSLDFDYAGLGLALVTGVTGSGKTFTMAQVIARVNRPALVMVHNKTLAAQLYQEFKRLFRDQPDLINTIKLENPQLWTSEFKKELEALFRKGVELEYRYAEDTMPRGVLGLNASMFKGYLRYIANRRATQIGLEPLYPNEENPFPWMSEMLDLKKERNFFETRVIEYQTGGALSWD